MRSTTYKKLKYLSSVTAVAIFGVVFVLGLLLPTKASASTASNTYALTCVGNGKVTVKGASVDCATHVVSVQGIGTASQAQSAGKPYPNTTALYVVKVTCSKGSPVDPDLGSVIDTFTCTKVGSQAVKPTVSQPTVLPQPTNPSKEIPIYGVDSSGNTIGGTAAKDSSCAANDGTCYDCANVNANSGKPGADNTLQKNCVGCANGTCRDPAANPDAKCTKNNCDLINKYLNPFIDLLSVSFGVIAIISLIFGGIQYASSAGDPQKVGLAKKRIINTVIAIVVYLFLFTFLQFLIPGGLFNRPEVIYQGTSGDAKQAP